jgi:hypothetical protein
MMRVLLPRSEPFSFAVVAKSYILPTAPCLTQSSVSCTLVVFFFASLRRDSGTYCGFAVVSDELGTAEEVLLSIVLLETCDANGEPV